MDDSYSGCLNEHHIRESAKLIDEKISSSCHDSIGDNVAFVESRVSCSDVDYLGNGGSGTFSHLSNLHVISSIDPKDNSVDCDISSPTRASSSHDIFVVWMEIN